MLVALVDDLGASEGQIDVDLSQGAVEVEILILAKLLEMLATAEPTLGMRLYVGLFLVGGTLVR